MISSFSCPSERKSRGCSRQRRMTRSKIKKALSRLLFCFCGVYYISLSFFASSGEMAERSKAAVSKTVNGIFPFGGSNPPLSAIFLRFFPSLTMVQWTTPEVKPQLRQCPVFLQFFLFAFFQGVLCPKDAGGVGARVRLRCFRGIRRRYGACMRRSGVSPAAGRTAAGSRRSWRA